MSSPFGNKDYSNSDSDSEGEKKRKYIKKRDEFSDKCETKKFHLTDFSAGVDKVAESLQVDMGESKEKFFPEDQDSGDDETLGEDEKFSLDEAEKTKSQLTVIEETQRSLSTSPLENDLTQYTKAHQVRRVRTKSENDQLVDWIQKHKNKKVKASLKDPSLRHSVDDSRRTLLHISAACGNVIVTEYTMDICDVNARDSNGRTALMLAVEQNHVHIVEMLLSLTDINILDNEGKDILHLVFAKKDLSKRIVMLLLQELRERYANSEVIAEKLVDSGCQMYQVVHTRDIALMKSMLNRGVNIDAADPEMKLTALHTSVALEEPEIVEMLLEAGADTETLDIHGMTPFVCNYACRRAAGNRKKLAILDLLLARRVSLTTTIEDGLLQVSTTLSLGCAEAIARLLRAGYLDFGAADALNGSRPMHYLASNCHRGVAQQLKVYAAEYDYYVNATDDNGLVPLYLAVRAGNVEIVQFLLEHGADPNYSLVEQNVHGFTPIYVSILQVPFERECLGALLQHKADPQASLTDNDGKVFGTLFDLEQRSMRLRPIVAHLALIERQGEPIAEWIRDKIHSRAEVRRYFERCQAVLDEELVGSISVLNLLTDSEKKVMGYLSNLELRSKLKKLNMKLRIQNSFWYYFNVLRKRVVTLLRLKGLRTEAAGIVCKWFENSLDEKHLVTERMLDFLDISSLEQLTSL